MAHHDPSSPPSPSAIARYGLAVLSVGIALGIGLLLRRFELKESIFLMGIAVTVWYARMGPGLLAIALSILSLEYFFIEPIYTINLDLTHLLYMIVFVGFALIISWFSASRRRAEQGLRQARDELERKVQERTASLREQADLLNLTHDAIFVRDMNRVVTYWNRGAEEFYGWKAEQALGKVTHELLHTVFPGVKLQQIEAELLRTGGWEGVLIHTKADGTKATVASRWALQRDEQDRPVAVLETNNDITARKLADDALRRQANLLEQTHDAVLAWEFPGTIVYWNRGAEQLYGFSRDEAMGRRSHDLLRTEHPMPTELFAPLLERQGAWAGELTHVTRDGRRIVVESRQSLMSEADGRRLVLETNRDLTERKRAEEALRQSQADLAHVSRVTTMGELTASLAHEVNQPIAAAVTNANTCLRWLTRERPDVEEARQAALRIVKDATRASEIISRIRLLFQKGAPQRELVDINELLQEMVVMLQSQAARHAIAIHAELAPGLPPIKADRVQLQQVFMNLMLNGIDAVKETGAAGELSIKSQRQDDALLISVNDTGVGLPPGKSDQIFNAFFTTKSHGIGMGLPISRSIIESHGGSLWAAPNSGRGASFQLTLPTKDEAME